MECESILLPARPTDREFVFGWNSISWLGAKSSVLFLGRQAAILHELFFLREPFSVLQTIASPFHLDALGVVNKAVQNGCGGGNIVEEFSPLLDRSVGSHKGGSVFIKSHDNLQENFDGFGWQNSQAHVVDLQEIWLEKAVHGLVQLSRRLVGLELAKQVEDGGVNDLESRFDEVIRERRRRSPLYHLGTFAVGADQTSSRA